MDKKVNLDLYGDSLLDDLQHVKPNPDERRQVAVRRCHDALVHACQCTVEKCTFHSCQRMKLLIHHFNNRCEGENSSRCQSCRQLVALCVYHSRDCKVVKCHVLFCIPIKQKVRQKKKLKQLRQTDMREVRSRLEAIVENTSIQQRPASMSGSALSTLQEMESIVDRLKDLHIGAVGNDADKPASGSADGDPEPQSDTSELINPVPQDSGSTSDMGQGGDNGNVDLDQQEIQQPIPSQTLQVPPPTIAHPNRPQITRLVDQLLAILKLPRSAHQQFEVLQVLWTCPRIMKAFLKKRASTSHEQQQKNRQLHQHLNHQEPLLHHRQHTCKHDSDTPESEQGEMAGDFEPNSEENLLVVPTEGQNQDSEASMAQQQEDEMPEGTESLEPNLQENLLPVVPTEGQVSQDSEASMAQLPEDEMPEETDGLQPTLQENPLPVVPTEGQVQQDSVESKASSSSRKKKKKKNNKLIVKIQ